MNLVLHSLGVFGRIITQTHLLHQRRRKNKKEEDHWNTEEATKNKLTVFGASHSDIVSRSISQLELPGFCGKYQQTSAIANKTMFLPIIICKAVLEK